MSSSIRSYLSVKKDEVTGDITLDNDRLQYIRTQYDDLYSQSNEELTDDQRKEETLKKLMEKLKLKDDQSNKDYLDICVTQRTEDDVKLEISSKDSGSVGYLHEPVISQSKNRQSDEKSKKKKSTKKMSNDENEECKDIDQLTCIIYKNLESSEVQDFMKRFLFRRVQGDDGQALKYLYFLHNKLNLLI
jgi:hypothetical protein